MRVAVTTTGGLQLLRQAASRSTVLGQLAEPWLLRSGKGSVVRNGKKFSFSGTISTASFSLTSKLLDLGFLVSVKSEEQCGDLMAFLLEESERHADKQGSLLLGKFTWIPVVEEESW